jgi:4-hydroxybenzoyl-CoA reductase subunit beta
MTLPGFEYMAPTTLEDAARILADGGLRATVIGGGTDLVPKMKRRQVQPAVLVSLSAIPAMRGIRLEGDQCIIGGSTSLREIAKSTTVPPVLAAAAGAIASPQIRNTATLGGNLCLATRCTYFDRSEAWRTANGHCLKDGGDVCWVAPRGDRCWAVSSSDLAPVAIALKGSVRLVSSSRERVIPVEELYQNDGIAPQTRTEDEILVELAVPADPGPASYHKLRRRGSIDFPIMSVAAAARFDGDGTCSAARIVLGAVSPAPIRAIEAEHALIGHRVTEEVVEEAAALATQMVRPQNNTDLGSRYRRRMVSVFVGRALRDVAGGSGNRPTNLTESDRSSDD